MKEHLEVEYKYPEDKKYLYGVYDEKLNEKMDFIK
jgi:hypothetical protein